MAPHVGSICFFRSNQLLTFAKIGLSATLRLSELKRTFQQHVRDDKKELLPAVLKALSDEETQAIVEGIEDTKAEVEEARRAEAEQRRAAAREEREQAENVRQTAESAAETMATTVAFPVHLARRTAETARENVKSSLNLRSAARFCSNSQAGAR